MEKTDYKELKERLLSGKKNGYDKLSEAELSAMEEYCGGYKAFLDAGKTERLCAADLDGANDLPADIEVFILTVLTKYTYLQ